MDRQKEIDIAYESMVLDREREALDAWSPAIDRTESFALKCNATRLLKLAPGSVVLDFGAGFCQVSEWLAETHAVTCVALDLFYDYLAMSQRRWRRRRRGNEPGRLSYVQGDGEQLGLRAESMDAVVTWAVLHHIPDLPLVVREIRRVLKPGGRCLVVEPNTLSPARRAKEMYLRVRYGMIEKSFVPSRLAETFAQAGFDVAAHDIAGQRVKRIERRFPRSMLHRIKNSRSFGPYLNEILFVATKR
jgi:ubiquinone/menaquinone biosynthesis C-methylase UbiE